MRDKSDLKNVLFIQFVNPAMLPPLEHGSFLLSEDGYDVTLIGIGSTGPSDRFRLEEHPNRTVRTPRFQPPGWRQKILYGRFMFAGLWFVLTRRPTWVYASDLLSCPGALLLSLIPGTRVIYHEHDAPAHTDSPGLFLKTCLWARRRLIARSRACVFPNESRRDNCIDAKKAATTVVVHNCPLRRDAIEFVDRTTVPGRGFRLLYQGSINRTRLPLSLVDALTRLPTDTRLTVVGYETVGSLGYLDEFMRKARSLNVDEQISCGLSFETRSGLIQECRRHDVGIALMPRDPTDINERTMALASNKAFDYLACGLSLLVSDLPDWQRAFVEPGFAVACDPDDPADIARSLLGLIASSERRVEMRQRALSRIHDRWNYETQFAPVMALMAEDHRHVL